MTNGNLDEDFIELSVKCKSVIACRMQPNQKVRIFVCGMPANSVMGVMCNV